MLTSGSSLLLSFASGVLGGAAGGSAAFVFTGVTVRIGFAIAAVYAARRGAHRARHHQAVPAVPPSVSVQPPSCETPARLPRIASHVGRQMRLLEGRTLGKESALYEGRGTS